MSCPRDSDEACASCVTVRVAEFRSGAPRAGTELPPAAVIPQVVGILDLFAVAVGVDRGEGKVAASLDLQYLGVSSKPRTFEPDNLGL